MRFSASTPKPTDSKPSALNLRIDTAMSAEASDMSSYLLMGLPGLAYLSGVADVGWTAIGLSVGTYLNWLLTAGRLRIYTHKTDSFTLPHVF